MFYSCGNAVHYCDSLSLYNTYHHKFHYQLISFHHLSKRNDKIERSYSESLYETFITNNINMLSVRAEHREGRWLLEAAISKFILRLVFGSGVWVYVLIGCGFCVLGI